MLKTKSNEIRFDSDSAQYLALLLHQGMVAATKLEIPRYKDLRACWKITVNVNHILIKRKMNLLEGPYNSFTGVSDLLDILDVWRIHKNSGIALKFPDAKVNDDFTSWLTTIPHIFIDKVLVLNPSIPTNDSATEDNGGINE